MSRRAAGESPAPPTGLERGLLEARLAAAAVAGLGLVSLAGATQVRTPAGYVAVSAAVMPGVVGTGLLALGIVLFLRATVRPDQDQARHIATEAARTHWATTGLTLGSLVAYAAALGPLGYVVATSLFVPTVARVLGSRRPLRDAVVGVMLALVVFVGFTRFLGVRLPAGILATLLP